MTPNEYETQEIRRRLLLLKNAPRWKYGGAGAGIIKHGMIFRAFVEGRNLQTVINGSTVSFNLDCDLNALVQVNEEVMALEKALKEAAFERSELTFTNLEKAARALLAKSEEENGNVQG